MPSPVLENDATTSPNRQAVSNDLESNHTTASHVRLFQGAVMRRSAIKNRVSIPSARCQAPEFGAC